MTYCLPGVSLKQKQDAVKKIHVNGIRGGTMEEISAVPAMAKLLSGDMSFERRGVLICPQVQSPNSSQQAEPFIPGHCRSPQPHLPPCEPLYSLCNGTNWSQLFPTGPALSPPGPTASLTFPPLHLLLLTSPSS